MAGAWEVQDHIDGLADAADNPHGLDRGLATMSAVAEQRTRLQVSHVALDCSTAKSLPIICWNQSLQVPRPKRFGSLLIGTRPGVMRSYLQCCVQDQVVGLKHQAVNTKLTPGMQKGVPLCGCCLLCRTC